MSTDNVDESRVVDINVASEDINDVMDETKCSAEFITYPKPKALVKLDDQISYEGPNTNSHEGPNTKHLIFINMSN